MTILKGCIIAALALAAGAWAETARADEAYVCEAGRVVYVKPGELETKKLQDPCIAKYFENVPSVKPKTAQASVATGDAAEVSPPVATPRPPAAKKAAAEPVGDYRNVRIINAAPGADSWFHHRR